MNDEWHVAEGTGWIEVPGFGRINPRQDSENGGRQYFTAMTDGGEHARVIGDSIRGGPETWHFEFDDHFWIADRSDNALQVIISLLPGGRYAVKYQRADWPTQATTGWSTDG